MLVHEIMNRGAADDIAIVDGEKIFTYSQAQDMIKIFRDRLYMLGVRKGDTVGLFSRNSAEFIFSYFATTSLGAIIVPINFQLATRETAFILKNAGIKHLLTYEKLAIDSVEQHDINNFAQLECNEVAPEIDIDENSACVIIYTSGTTGNPKGAVLSHKNLVHNTKQCAGFKTSRSCKVLCVLPMYHCFEWTCAVLNTFYTGASAHIMRVFKPREMVDMIRDNGLTDIIIVPSIYRMITPIAKAEDLKTIRFAMSGGTILPDKIVEEFQTKFNLPIHDGYGLSEASPCVFLTTHGESRVGSVGVKLADEEIRLVDDNGEDVKIGEPGEILVRGGQVMLGYWNNEKATAETIDNEGWLHTGDIAKVDSDGYYYIVNRIKEMIISMGENIYPREVEEIVYQYPGIDDAAVVGVDDKLRGEVCACFYTVADGAKIKPAELKKFLQKNLAVYKVPKVFYELDEMPRTSTGKISKKDILANYKNK